MTFPLGSHARNVSSFANRCEPPYVTRRFGARMIWHESPPKQQPHPRLWLAQVQQPLPDRRAKPQPLLFLPLFTQVCGRKIPRRSSPRFCIASAYPGGEWPIVSPCGLLPMQDIRAMNIYSLRREKLLQPCASSRTLPTATSSQFSPPTHENLGARYDPQMI